MKRPDGVGTLRFSPFEIDADRQCLKGPSGELRLRPKAFDVLRHLVLNAGRTVGKEELLEFVWPGINVTDESLTQCISEIRQVLGNEHRRIIKTIPKRGYRLDAEVLEREFSFSGTASDQTYRPSIAVLPFAVVSKDQVPAYFSEGFTDDIVTTLSRWRWLRVIALNSTHFYRDPDVDIRVVAEDLGVRYVVRGNIRLQNSKLRITIQVIEALSRQQIWADRFDGDVKDVFELSDRITRCLATAIDPALQYTEIERLYSKRTANLDAWDCFLRASSEFRRFKKPAMARARALYENAIRIDPHMAQAHARLAGAHGLEAILGWSGDYRQSLDAAHEAANVAISLDELDALGYVALARASLWTRLYDGALLAATTSMELNPNCHEAVTLHGQCLTFGGRPLEAVKQFDLAIQLSPRDPLAWATHGLKSLALFLSDQYDDAIQEADRALTRRPRYSVARMVKAASLAMLHRFEEAKSERSVVSSMALLNFEARWPFRYEADRSRVLRALLDTPTLMS